MNHEFKKIVLNLAKLPRKDQLWVLKQLSFAQQEQFNQFNGHELLNKARKFRKLGMPELSLKKEPSLPAYCMQLRLEEPLFIAIILEQGAFAWEKNFLQSCLHQQQIIEQLERNVPTLKTATKSYLYQQWQQQLSFAEQLESVHG